MQLTVRVKKGLVSFKPLRAAGQRVFGVKHYVSGNQDCWRYSFKVKNLAVLRHPVYASMKLSVPVAGIKQRHFQVWLMFGKKTTQSSAVVQRALAQGDSAPAAATAGNAAAPTAAPSATTASPAAAFPASSVASARPTPKNSGASKSSLAAATPKVAHQKQAVIPLRHYPTIWVAAAFLVSAGLIIAITYFWRRRLLKRVHDEK